MEQRLSVITLGVKNMQHSRNFYEHGLGWQVSAKSRESLTLFQIGGLVLALYPEELLREEVDGKENGGFSGITLAHNTYSKQEVNHILKRAEMAGAKILKPAHDTFWGGYSGYFADPDGYVFEIAWNPFWPLDENGNIHI